MTATNQRLFLRFDRRDFSKPLPAPDYRFHVDYMTWDVMGGPDEAGFLVQGNLLTLTNLAQLLRVPVTVTDPYGGAMWWGFVNEVEIHFGGLVYAASLEGMANKVAVRYREEAPTGGSAAGWETQTSFLSDTDSQGLYGIKEEVVDLGEGRQADAEALRATTLAKIKLPKTKSLPGDEIEKPYGILKLTGWWKTLGWRMFVEDRGYVGNIEWQGTDYSWGQAAATTAIAQQFLCPGSGLWYASNVWVRLFKVGAPADNVLVELWSVAAGAPAAVLATSSVAGSAVQMEPSEWTQLTFTTPYVVTPSTVYAIVLQRTGAVDANNYYGVRVEAGIKLGYNFQRWSGAVWSAVTPNVSMIVGMFGQDSTTNRMRKVATTALGGQFLRGITVRTESGVNMGIYRTGKETALKEMEEALGMGLSTGQPMQARISADRYLIVEQRPAIPTGASGAAANPDLLVMATGEVKYRNGRPLIGSDNPVGRWARIESLQQAGGDYGAQSTVFLSRAEWRDGKIKVWWE